MTWGLTEWVQVLEQCFTLDRFWHWLQDWSYVVKRRHLSWSCDDYGVDSFLFSSTADLCLLYQFMALLQSLYSTKTSVNMPYRRAYQVSLWGFLCVCFVFVLDAFDFENCHLIHVSSSYFLLDRYLSLWSSQDTVWEVEGKRWLENGSQGMVQQTCFFIHIAFNCLKSVVL